MIIPLHPTAQVPDSLRLRHKYTTECPKYDTHHGDEKTTL